MSEIRKEPILNNPEEHLHLLNRILSSVEKDSKSQFLEIAIAILLSLSTVGSAWCAFQSTLWNGNQTFELAESNKAGRDASEGVVISMERKSFEAILFIHFIEALSEEKEELANFFYQRFPENLKKATDEWLKTNPMKNPNAPKSPFEMDSYTLPEEKLSKDLRQLSSDKMETAVKSNKNADTYVLLTVLFASVLFFAGIGSTIRRKEMRLILIIMAICLFTGTVIALAQMPMTTIR